MFPVLLTTTNERQPDAVVAWDPLGGNPIATLSGETAQRGSVTRYAEGVVCASAKKPLIQLWNLQSASSSYKRILTKGLVSAITITPDSEYIFIALEREVYVYQTSSGCLIGVFGGSHSAKIGEMRLVNWLNPEPAMLLTADVSGFLACWSLGSLVDELSLLTSSSSDSKEVDGGNATTETVNHTQIPPLWYALQASHHLPRIEVFQQLALVAGSEGLKVYSLPDGHVIATTLSDVPGGLHSVTVVPTNGKTFCGGADGLLYSSQITVPKITVITDREVRRCFVNSKLPGAQKTITELALSPFDHSLLAVGARGGLIEVLRPDAMLTCLHQFCVLNPTLSKADSSCPYQLTGLCFVPRPNWLSGASNGGDTVGTQHTHSGGHRSDSDGAIAASRGSCDIEPFKRHLGWRLDDVVRVRLPAMHELVDTRAEMTDIYMDEFHAPGEGESGETQESETKQLLDQIQKLNSINREMFRQLMDRELQG
ncbi:WD repeat-containing protein 18 [Fasciola hepatica]|uniref:WD repeat-containing protein 18 n=1 Tax=Fasciola hepatica TaxID=6192 RepID=A0A4E0R020_FASHE|nr:WD repeat-containing protein 18 [Fasciola hepatica]